MRLRDGKMRNPWNLAARGEQIRQSAWVVASAFAKMGYVILRAIPHFNQCVQEPSSILDYTTSRTAAVNNPLRFGRRRASGGLVERADAMGSAAARQRDSSWEAIRFRVPGQPARRRWQRHRLPDLA